MKNSWGKKKGSRDVSKRKKGTTGPFSRPQPIKGGWESTHGHFRTSNWGGSKKGFKNRSGGKTFYHQESEMRF